MIRATQDIKTILNIGAEPDISDFTLATTIAVMEDIMEGMNCALEECCATVKAQLGDLGTQEAQEAINRLYLQKFPLVNDAVHKKHNCDKATIEVRGVSYGNSDNSYLPYFILPTFCCCPFRLP